MKKEQTAKGEVSEASKSAKDSPNQISILSNLIKYEKISSKKLKTDVKQYFVCPKILSFIFKELHPLQFD